MKTEPKVEPTTEVEPEKKPEGEAKPAYEPFKAPEGVELNAEVMTEASGLFKELGLDQAAAQRLVDFYVKNATNETKAVEKVYEDLRSDWQTKTKSDPVIGAKLTEVKRDTDKGLTAALGAQAHTALKAALDLTGAGDHPDIIKAFYKLTERWIEGTHVRGGNPAPVTPPNAKPASLAQRVYPNLPSSAG